MSDDDRDEKRWLMGIKLAVLFWVVLMFILMFGANHAR